MIKSVPTQDFHVVGVADHEHLETAMQIARVGAVPCKKPSEPGKQVWLAGQLFMALNEITREEFMALVEAAGLGYLPFHMLSDDYKFQRVSTD